MATSMLGELSCSMCLDTFTDPVTLPCMHSFCRQCLLDLSKSCGTSDLYNRAINCPECRQTTNLGTEGVKDLPKNCTLANLIEKLDKVKEEQLDPNCSVCDTSPARIAVKACFECNLSYCSKCIVLHPSRGALAQHVLVDLVDLKEEDSCTPAMIVEETNKGDDRKIFCHTCNELVDNEECHQKLDHKTTGLREARMKKCESLEATLEEFEKARRKYRRAINYNESSVERLKKEKQKQLDDLTKLMAAIRNTLSTKESELTQSIQRQHTDCVNKTEMEIKSKKAQLSEITSIITLLHTLLEQEQDDSSFLKKSMDLEKSMQTFEHQVDESSSQMFETDLTDVRKIATDIKNILEKKGSDRRLHVVEETVQKIEDKVSLIAVTPKWNESMFVQWFPTLPEQSYDVKVLCIDRDDTSEEKPDLVYSSVRQTELLLCNLSAETEYTVTVMVHGHPESESEPMRAKTLPVITDSFTFDIPLASLEAEFFFNGSVMMHEDQLERSIESFDNICGTVSSIYLSPCHYWEVDLTFFMGRLNRSGETAYEIGICPELDVDNAPSIKENDFAYICCHSRHGYDAFFECYAEGELVKKTKVSWQKPFKLKLGFFVNEKKETLHVINVDNEEICMTFTGIDSLSENNYVAVFDMGEGGGKTKIKMELKTGDDIESIPDVFTNLI